MSQQSANRLPVKDDRVWVDKSHVAHGGKRGLVIRVDDSLSGHWCAVKFDGVPGRRSHTGVVHANYLIVEKATNAHLCLAKAPYQEGRDHISAHAARRLG